MVDIVYQRTQSNYFANFNNTPQELIQAVVSSNSTRMDFIAEEILKSKPETIGFYRLVMKKKAVIILDHLLH